jgi:hypothetical protein
LRLPTASLLLVAVEVVMTSLYSEVMTSLARKPPAWVILLRRLLAWLSQDWLITLLELAQQFGTYLTHQNQDLYENLNYHATLELLTATGKTAVFRKEQRVQFLQNHIIAFEDYAWGDGDVLADYRCTPGVEADRYREGDRWNILISLRETRSRGDIAEFYIERVEKNTFTQAEEWLQTEIRRPTHRLQMDIIFPQERPCQRAVVIQRSRNRVTVLEPTHFNLLPNGRQLVRWVTGNVRTYELYTLKWWW